MSICGKNKASFCIYILLCHTVVFSWTLGEKPRKESKCKQYPLKQYWDEGCKTCTNCRSLGQPTRVECGQFSDEVCEDFCIEEDRYFDDLTKTCLKKTVVITSTNSVIGTVQRKTPASNKKQDGKGAAKVANTMVWLSHLGIACALIIIAVPAAIGVVIWIKFQNRGGSAPSTVEEADSMQSITHEERQGGSTTFEVQEECNEMVDLFDGEPGTDLTHINHQDGVNSA